MNGTSALIKGTPELSSSLSAMGEHSAKTTVCAPGSGPSPEAQSAGALILNFPASKTMIDKCWLLQPPCGILL